MKQFARLGTSRSAPESGIYTIELANDAYAGIAHLAYTAFE
jgi:hypothetical protein